MARPSKTQFAIYEDVDTTDVDGIPPRAPERQPLPRNDSVYGQHDRKEPLERVSETEAEEDVDEEPSEEDEGAGCLVASATDDADDERRQSAVTSTSISSLPESAFETDYEAIQTPPMIRPSFRRPESVRRMQMSSPAPSERSLRRSILSPPRARTPRSNRSSVKGSPRPKRLQQADFEEEKKDYPLVLLHVSLLPVEFRWSTQNMQNILPAGVLESMQLLRSKISETVADRGILIPHPREEYDVLEERLLEVLELKKSRVTKCGHFRARESTSSTSSADSGIATSVESIDGELCQTCQHHLRTADGAISSGGRSWSIKVFAANGLMRASAWSAAWSEMESVDVEILPWIGEDLRKKLDARAVEEEAELRAMQKEEDARIKEMAEQQIRLAREERRLMRDVRKSQPAPSNESATPPSTPEPCKQQQSQNDLPQVYRPKDIPLSLLLQNYVYLLAQDKRNIVIFVLMLLTVWMSLGMAIGQGKVEMSPMPPSLRESFAVYTTFPSVTSSQASMENPDTTVTTSSSFEAVSPTASSTATADTTPLSSDCDDVHSTLLAKDPDALAGTANEDDICVNMANMDRLFGTGRETPARV